MPELKIANKKWTDEYVASYFNGDNHDGAPQSMGGCQQSVDNFFAFHRPEIWSEDILGPPPSLDLRWTFDKWARHAVYADAVGLPVNTKHYYWQSGVQKEERLQKEEKWTFVSRDLPSFSSPDTTFFGFNPPEQKGIQCRFGERGVTAATHYDGGRNMIAMITGAKRYILSPPNVCPKLGIVTAHRVSVYSAIRIGYQGQPLPLSRIERTSQTALRVTFRLVFHPFFHKPSFILRRFLRSPPSCHNPH